MYALALAHTVRPMGCHGHFGMRVSDPASRARDATRSVHTVCLQCANAQRANDVYRYCRRRQTYAHIRTHTLKRTRRSERARASFVMAPALNIYTFFMEIKSNSRVRVLVGRTNDQPNTHSLQVAEDRTHTYMF